MLLIFLFFGLMAGLIRGGKIAYINKNMPEGLWLPILAYTAEILASLDSLFPGWFLILLEYGMLFWFTGQNRGSGVWPSLFFAGTMMNFLVIFHNGFRMPVSAYIMSIIGNDTVAAALNNHEIFGYTLADETTKLIFLSDIIAVPLIGGSIGFASIGDIVLGIGAAILIYKMTLPKESGRDNHTGRQLRVDREP